MWKKFSSFQCVLLSHFSGFVDAGHVESYQQNREKNTRRARGLPLLNAVTKCEEFLADPIVCTDLCFIYFSNHVTQTKIYSLFQKFRAHAVVLPIGSEIIIKTEPTFIVKVEQSIEQLEIHHRVAVEKKTADHCCAPQLNRLNAEKIQLLSELVEMREQYDRVCDNLNSKTLALENLQERHDMMANEKEAEIERLRLVAKNLKQTLVRTNKDGVYNVDIILEHKMVGSEYFFLLRWKNFGPEFDSWEPRCNLFCKKLLKAYETKNNLISTE